LQIKKIKETRDPQKYMVAMKKNPKYPIIRKSGHGNAVMVPKGEIKTRNISRSKHL